MKNQVYIKIIKILKDNINLDSENTVKISFHQEKVSQYVCKLIIL